MKIAVRAEGGAGDVLLQNRFVPAIREKYPNSEITLYIDSEGKTFQKELVEYLYPSFYKEIKIIPNKKYKEFWIESQYGLENQIGFIENVPDDILKEMIENYDLFFDMHLDSLKFIEYNFDWKKYFYQFPKPEISPPNYLGNYIVSHLISSTSKEHRLDDFYVTRLVTEIDKFCQKLGWQHIVISTPEFNKYYEEALKSCKNSHILNGNIKNVCDIIVNAKLMISVDSGFRPVAYPLMPVLSLSKQCFSPYQMPESHIIRWNPIKPYFPLNWNTRDIIDCIKILLENPVYQIFNLCDWKNQLIKREYKVSEKSIINI